MNAKMFIRAALAATFLMAPQFADATKFMGLKVIDKDYLMIQFRDGEVHYRDSGIGESAYLGHTFVEGDDTLFVFAPRLDGTVAGKADGWTISSKEDKSFGSKKAVAAYRRSKPMNIDHTLTSENDHSIFLKLPQSMKQGCTYTVSIPAGLGSDVSEATVKFDIWNSQSEAVHVNILGYLPTETVKEADLYLWLGDGGERDYSSFVGNKVYLYNVNTGKSSKVSSVKFWKKQNADAEAGKKDLTASSVWNIDFAQAKPGKYRLVVDGVGCSMDFDISNDVYYQPFRYSVRGYYYMRVGEPIDTPRIVPIPRQPQFLAEEDPIGFTIYKTDLHPWHQDWRKMRGDVWDEPHFKPALESYFWEHRLPGNPVAIGVKGGHSDAYDWDRHLSHVVNIYDMLLPYILTNGRIGDDDLTIRESGNGVPDIIDEARNEVDFFLSIRDGEGYSQGLTNPAKEWTIMFQAGCTTIAAWANAANCAMTAAALKIAGNEELTEYYTKEAVTAYNYASRQENLQLNDRQDVMTGRDFRQLAAAFLYNVTGERKYEDQMAEDSQIKDANSRISGTGGQIWATAAYLACPQERHYPELYKNMKAVVNAIADTEFLEPMKERPSRRPANDTRHRVAENLQVVMLAHYIADNSARRTQLERAMYSEAGWGLGRNPSNTVEMTGLGERHITDCYSTGHNDGVPGTHPGQTPFNGVETWSRGDGGDATTLVSACYPEWNSWPQQESFFNQRYYWVNGEFTPRETMRGKMALLGYLYGIRK